MGTVCSSIFNKSYVHFRITDKVILHPSLQQLMVVQDDITGNLVFGININVDDLDIKDRAQLERHQLLTHANILRFEGFKKNNDKEYLALFESFECTLAEEIQARKEKNLHYSEQEILGILQNVTAALAYFQNKDIYHGGVTSDNIVKKGEEYKLLDLVLFEKYQTTYQQALYDGNESNVKYLSPELKEALAKQIENPPFKKYKQDVFSLGMIILDAMTLDTESPISAKLKLSFQYFSESLVEVVTKMIQENELFRLDSVSCYKIIESIYYGFPVAEDSDQLMLTTTINNQTKSVLSGYEEYEASPTKPIRSSRKGYASVGGATEISASNVIFKTDMTMEKPSFLNTEFSVERFPRKTKEAAFLQGLGSSVEGLREDTFLEAKPSAILHVPQSTFEAVSKDDWQFGASPNNFRNLDPLYSESIALTQGMDSVYEPLQYKQSPPKRVDLLGMGNFTQATINDSKMSTTDYAPNYLGHDLLLTHKTEENEYSEKSKKSKVPNARMDTLTEQATYMQSPSQIRKNELFSPLRYSSHPDIVSNIYANKEGSNTPSGKDYFSNTTFGTHPANSIELSSQKLNALGNYATVGLSTKKLYENLLMDSNANLTVDLMNLTQPQPISINQSHSVSQAVNPNRFKDSSTQMSAQKDPRNGQESDSYTYNTPQLYSSQPTGVQKKNYRDPNIMTIEEYHINDGHHIHPINEENYTERSGNNTNRKLEAEGYTSFKSLGDHDGYQNYKKHNRNKTLATNLGSEKTSESIIGNYRTDLLKQKHKTSASEYVYRSLDLPNAGMFGSDRKRFGDLHRHQQSMFSNGSSFQYSTFSKGRRENNSTVSYALENLRNEMKNSFLSESDSFLEKRLLKNKRKPNTQLETLQNDIDTIKGTQSIDNTKFSILLNESLEKEPAPRLSHSHKRSLTLSFITKTQQKSPEKIVKVYEDGLRYEGDMQGDLRHGQGKLILQDGIYYEGSWKLDRIDGYGTLRHPSGRIIYQGEWRNNKYEGSGASYNDQPNQLFESYTKRPFDESEKTWIKYEGEFNNHKWHGFGKLTLSNGDVFQGNFKMGIMHGRGNYTSSQGHVVVGEWHNNGLVQAF